MTWSQEVSLIFLDILDDPEIIIYLMQIAKPTHHQFLTDEAREFHESLRVTPQKRWTMSKELSERGEFYKMNTYVPITFPLPFNNGRWLRSQKLLEMIPYFLKNFIRITYLMDQDYIPSSDSEVEPLFNYPRVNVNWAELGVRPVDYLFGEWDAPLPTKIKSVNLIFDETVKGSNFRTNLQQREIQYTLADMIRQDDNIWSNSPYLLIHSPIVSYGTKNLINKSVKPNHTYGDFFCSIIN